MVLSRSEEILSSKINGEEYLKPAQSRLEKMLLELNTSTGVDTTVLSNDVEALKKDVDIIQTHAIFDGEMKEVKRK